MAVYYPNTQYNGKCTREIMCLKSIGEKFRYLMHGDVTDGCHDAEITKRRKSPANSRPVIAPLLFIALVQRFYSPRMKG